MSRPPHPSMNRRDWMERHIVCRRQRDDAFHEEWRANEKYFKTCDVKATIYNTLSSPETYQLSMNAYQEQRGREEEERVLSERRKKLSALLQQEKEQYEQELKVLLSQRRHKWYPLLVAESTSPQIPSTAVTPNCPPDRVEEIASVADCEPFRPLSVAQLENATQYASARDKDSNRVESALVAEKDNIEKNCKSLEVLLGSVRHTEREASHLKQGQTILQQCLNELHDKIRQRDHLNKQQRRLNWSKMLMRPFKIQIQLCTRNKIESMEFDVKFVDVILSLLRKVDLEDGTLRVDLERFKMKLLQDLRHENYQLLESENLFQEEAERLWNPKVQNWEEEQASRDSLIAKLTCLVESKLQSRLAANLEKQQENIGTRETLLHDLDSLQCGREGRQCRSANLLKSNSTAPMATESPRRVGSPKDLSLPAIDRLHL